MFELLHNLLSARGFSVLEHDKSWFYAKGPKFRVRAFSSSQQIQVGFNSTFDRWANSVDYETSLPKNEREVERLVEVAEAMVKCSRCSNWTHSPHKIANRQHCDRCHERLEKGKDQYGKRHR